MVVAQGTRVITVGVVIGIAVAISATRALGSLLDSLLFGVGALDVATFLGVAATVIVIGTLASYIPALRASRVNPIESLRND